MGVDGFSGVPVRRIRVDAGNQVQHVAVDPATGNVRVPLSGANVDRLRVTVVVAGGDRGRPFVGRRGSSRDFAPQESRSGGSSSSARAARPVTQTSCSAQSRIAVPVWMWGSVRAATRTFGRTSEEEAGLYRTFTTDGSGEWSVWGSVVARATPAAAELLSPVSSRVRVQASSSPGR